MIPVRPTTMKIRINKSLLSRLPAPIAAIVSEFRDRSHKTHISGDRRSSFYVTEDATYTAFGPDGKSMTIRAGGEWAGVTALMPGHLCPLPQGCVIVEQGFFCGVPYLNVYENPALIKTLTGQAALDWRAS